MLDEKALLQKAECFKRVFFYRICGTGMAPAAGLLKQRGLEVEGHDVKCSPPMDSYLREMGIKCHPPEAVTTKLLRSFDLIVVGNVVARGSDEAQMIERLGVHFCSFPAALGAMILRRVKVVGICGTHGKTTTTYFAVQLFERLGQEPGYFIGGVIPHRPCSKWTQGNYFFIEGDEYDSAYFHKVSKFRSYHLHSMILTSLEFDHADIFASIEDIEQQFYPVMQNLTTIVGCDEYPQIHHLLDHHLADGTKVLWYGKHFPKILKQTPTKTHFQLQWQGKLLEFYSNIVGKHNIDNLAAAILYALHEGFGPLEIQGAVENLQQVKRRQELKGYYRGCPLIDDFAHHPTAIECTIEAVRVCYPGKKINVIFEPASATARSGAFQQEFVPSFAASDRILVLKPSKPTTAKNFGDIDWQKLQVDLSLAGQRTVAMSSELSQLLQFIDDHAREDNLFLVLSNGTCQGLWESTFIKQLKNG